MFSSNRILVSFSTPSPFFIFFFAARVLLSCYNFFSLLDLSLIWTVVTSISSLYSVDELFYLSFSLFWFDLVSFPRVSFSLWGWPKNPCVGEEVEVVDLGLHAIGCKVWALLFLCNCVQYPIWRFAVHTHRRRSEDIGVGDSMALGYSSNSRKYQQVFWVLFCFSFVSLVVFCLFVWLVLYFCFDQEGQPQYFFPLTKPV